MSVVGPYVMAPFSSFRWGCTLLYFGTLLFICWLLLGPRERYMKELSDWKYQDCPQMIRNMQERYLYNQELVFRGCALLGIFFTCR